MQTNNNEVYQVSHMHIDEPHVDDAMDLDELNVDHAMELDELNVDDAMEIDELNVDDAMEIDELHVDDAVDHGIYIEIPEGARIHFVIENGVRYLVLTLV